MNIDSKQRTQLLIALGAVVALVLGYSVLSSSDDASSTNAIAAQGNVSQQGQVPQDGPRGQGGPGNGGPGGGQMPQEVTGSAATKAKAAAEKKTDGEAQNVMKARSGSGYVVFVSTDDGPVLVELDEEFKVTDERELPARPGGGQGGHQGEKPGQPPAIEGGDLQ